MIDSKSCLVSRLSNHIEIDARLEELLAALEKTEQEFGEDALVFSGGDEAKNLYVVKEGWFLSYTDLADGSRLVVNVYHPGDIIGFSGIAFDHQSLYLKSCLDGGLLCPFAKDDLDVIFSTAPKLTALLMSLAVREKILFIDRLKGVSRMNAQHRMAQFLLDLAFRQRAANKQLTNEFILPLTQTEIGDAIGLTNVSVSRTFTRMEEEKLVKRTSHGVILLDEQALIDSCEYEDRHSKVDTSWFPSGI